MDILGCVNGSERSRVAWRELGRDQVGRVTRWTAAGAAVGAALVGVVLAHGSAAAAATSPPAPAPVLGPAGESGQPAPGLGSGDRAALSPDSDSGQGSSSGPGGGDYQPVYPQLQPPPAAPLSSQGGGHTRSGGS